MIRITIIITVLITILIATTTKYNKIQQRTTKDNKTQTSSYSSYYLKKKKTMRNAILPVHPARTPQRWSPVCLPRPAPRRPSAAHRPLAAVASPNPPGHARCPRPVHPGWRPPSRCRSRPGPKKNHEATMAFWSAMCLCVYISLFIYLFIYSFIYLFIYLFMYLIIYLFICMNE